MTGRRFIKEQIFKDIPKDRTFERRLLLEYPSFANDLFLSISDSDMEGLVRGIGMNLDDLTAAQIYYWLGDLPFRTLLCPHCHRPVDRERGS